MTKASFITIVIQEAAGLKISQASMAMRLIEGWGQKLFSDAMLCMPRFPVGINLLSLCCASASYSIPITMLQFFSSFSPWSVRGRKLTSCWATQWEFSEQERYCTVPQTELFLSSWSPTMHFPYIHVPRRKMWPPAHSTALQRVHFLTPSGTLPSLISF